MVDNTTTKDSALEILKTKLLEGGEMVSSEETGFEEAIAGIKTGLTEAQKKVEAGAEAKFERLEIEAREVGERRLVGAREAARGLGPASQMALVTRMEESTEKSIRDLELRKTEAIAAGQTELATTLANLQLKEIEFRTTQRQQAFTNLMSLASMEFEEERVGFEREKVGFEAEKLDIAREGLTLQERQVSIAGARQRQEERTAISNIALSFGLEISEDDTLDTMVAKAQPFASAQQKLDMEKQRAEVANIKASTQKLLKEATGLDDATLDIIAEAATLNSAVLGTLENPEDVAKVINKMTELSKPKDFSHKELTEIGQTALNEGKTFQEALGVIAGDARITNKEEGEAVIRILYKRPKDERNIFEKFIEAFPRKKTLEEELEEARKK